MGGRFEDVEKKRDFETFGLIEGYGSLDQFIDEEDGMIRQMEGALEYSIGIIENKEDGWESLTGKMGLSELKDNLEATRRRLERVDYARQGLKIDIKDQARSLLRERIELLEKHVESSEGSSGNEMELEEVKVLLVSLRMLLDDPEA